MTLILYVAGPSFRSRIDPTLIVNIDATDPFNGSTVELGPGEELSVNPVITNHSTVDVYAIYRVSMPAVELDGEWVGLYEIVPQNSWSLIENSREGGEWIEVYGTLIGVDDESGKLTDKIKMRDISLREYSELGDLNIQFDSFGANSNEVGSMEEGWAAVKDGEGL